MVCELQLYNFLGEGRVFLLASGRDKSHRCSAVTPEGLGQLPSGSWRTVPVTPWRSPSCSGSALPPELLSFPVTKSWGSS